MGRKVFVNAPIAFHCFIHALLTQIINDYKNEMDPTGVRTVRTAGSAVCCRADQEVQPICTSARRRIFPVRTMLSIDCLFLRPDRQSSITKAVLGLCSTMPSG